MDFQINGQNTKVAAPANSTKRKLAAVLAVGLCIVSSAGCSASKEETRKQLDNHLKAYEIEKITPGNSLSLITAGKILLSPDKSNRFKDSLTDSDISKVQVATQYANEVYICQSAATNYNAQSFRDLIVKNPDPKRARPIKDNLQKLADCNKKTLVLNSAQSKNLAMDLSKFVNYVKRLDEEERLKQKKLMAEKRRKECSEALDGMAESRHKWIVYSDAVSGGEYGGLASMDYSSKARDAWNNFNRLKEFILANCE